MFDIGLIITLSVAFYFGYLFGGILTLKRLGDNIPTPPFLMVDILITKHNDIFLVHGKNTNEFITQGKSKSEILEKLALRHPYTKFMISAENIKELSLNDDF